MAEFFKVTSDDGAYAGTVDFRTDGDGRLVIAVGIDESPDPVDVPIVIEVDGNVVATVEA